MDNSTVEKEQPSLVFTGERMVPSAKKSGDEKDIYWYHVNRYMFASQFAKGKNVMDVASGEGYGSDILGTAGAASVLGVDIAQEAVDHAMLRYGREHVSYTQGSALDLPAEDASKDLFVSFETIEHFTEGPTFVREIARVLKPGGMLVISVPNPGRVDTEPGMRYYRKTSTYHIREYYKDDLAMELEPYFRVQEWYAQGGLNLHEEKGREEQEKRIELKKDTTMEGMKRAMERETRVLPEALIAVPSYYVATAVRK